MASVSISVDASRAVAALDALARKQLPYAATVAVNDLAFQVQRAETAAIPQVFAHPRPFTARSVIVNKATKSSPVAMVMIRPEVAKYLRPYEDGGAHVLPGKALLDPKNIRLDQYGQLTRGTPQRLAAKPGVFIGQVHGVRGFWQRLKNDRLKLLIRFGNALQVKKRLGFRQRADALVLSNFTAAFGRAFAKAFASARR